MGCIAVQLLCRTNSATTKTITVGCFIFSFIFIGTFVGTNVYISLLIMVKMFILYMVKMVMFIHGENGHVHTW